MVLLAWLMYAFNIFHVGGFALALFAIPLLIFGWGFGILITGFVFQLGARVSIFTWSLPFLFYPISAVFYPVSVLPPALQKIAFWVPLTHVFEGFRAAVGGVFVVREFVWALGLAVVYFILFYFVFAWCVRRSKERGFLAKQ